MISQLWRSARSTTLGWCLLAGSVLLVISGGYSVRQLMTAARRIQEDLTFSDERWDMSAYNGDPQLAASSSIYILANDGFVLERWKPIAGFLDSSDFKHLLAFTTIQTVETNANQDWRMLSVPITENEQVVGVVTVSSYHPLAAALPTFDDQMHQAAAYVLEHVVVQKSQVTLHNFDQRKIPHYLSFQVVNRANKIIVKGNNTNSIDRLPDFIDPSYVADQLRASPVQLIRDKVDGELFVIFRQQLTDESGATKGVMVVGQSLSYLLVPFTIFVIGFVSLFVASQLGGQLYAQRRRTVIKPKVQFDEQLSLLIIGQHKMKIAYASNQYYLCKAAIQQPQKRWEVDELMDSFGEELSSSSWRKVYDAMNQINKKVQPYLNQKLIVLEEKTFRLNPELHS